jgi:hypothetical protein
MPRPNRLRARQRILESLNGGFTKRLAETGQVSDGVVSWITVQTVSTLITGKIIGETGKCVAEKWHFLALFGRFWRGLQCHFVAPGASTFKVQTANLLAFMSIAPARKRYP